MFECSRPGETVSRRDSVATDKGLIQRCGCPVTGVTTLYRNVALDGPLIAPLGRNVHLRAGRYTEDPGKKPTTESCVSCPPNRGYQRYR